MSSNEKKLNIRDAINMTNYPLNIRQGFAKFLESTYGSQKHKLYLFVRNETAPKLFLLQLQIPAKFNGQSYDISLLVYFPLNFPEIEPEIFFEKIGTVKINPNCTFYIDEDTLKINYSLFYSWGKSMESFRGLIAELYNQFNIAFPVFNLTNKNDNNDGNNDKDEDQSDCVFQKNLCKEIELIKPEVRKMQMERNNNQNNYNQQSNYNNNQNINNTDINNINKGMNNLNINNDPPIAKTNIYGRPINNNQNQNNNYNMNNNMDKFRNSDYNKINNNMNNKNMNDFRNSDYNKINSNMKMNNNNNNNNQMNQNSNNQNIPVFDEKNAKLALINLLKNSLSQKINYAIQPITTSYLKLERLKENITKKLKDFDVVESKENAIRQTIDTLHKDMNFTITTSPKEIEKPDLTNLESILVISNKDYYLRLAKEKTIEEYILLIKKSYEKHNIDFNTALNLIRINSRNIFFLKYKNAKPFGC